VSHPVVHFEVVGKDPDRLRRYFGELFGWQLMFLKFRYRLG
jgi:predicted enzyme related to lactoylglutathione lyase